jgi:hypothetical protein
MSYLTIGSGDVGNLLQAKNTKGYAELWRKFLAESSPYYNAYASPIDALRTGAILEDVYAGYLSDNYFVQMKYTSKKMDVFTCSIDFSGLEKGSIVHFEELKTAFFTDFVNIIKPLAKSSEDKQLDFIKKKFKKNYNQIQSQLFATELEEATLTFLSVESYDDQVNQSRIIKDEDVVKFRIPRNEKVIDFVQERLKPFQDIKDHFND